MAVDSRFSILVSLCVVVGAAIVGATFADTIWKSPLKEVSAVLRNALAYISYKVPSLDLSDVQPPSFVPVLEAIVGVILMYGGYRAFLVPMNRIRLLGDVGYIQEGGVRSSEMVTVVQKRRMVGNVPPVYPNGWFSVIESRELAVGVAKSVSCLGRSLLLHSQSMLNSNCFYCAIV